MKIVVDNEIFQENERIDIQFSNGITRSVDAFDLVLARRALQDAIVARMTPDAEDNDEDDAMATSVYTPLFEERLAIKFDPDGLSFFIYPMQKDHAGAYADVRYPVSLEYIDDEEDDVYEHEIRGR